MVRRKGISLDAHNWVIQRHFILLIGATKGHTLANKGRNYSFMNALTTKKFDKLVLLKKWRLHELNPASLDYEPLGHQPGHGFAWLKCSVIYNLQI